MPFPTVTFRSELDPVTRKELDHFAAQLQEYLAEDHHGDGTHSDVVADSVTLRDDGEGLIFDGGEDDATITHSDGILTLDASAEVVIKRDAVEQFAFGRATANSGTEQQASGFLAALGALRLAGQSSYTPSAGDQAALADGTYAPSYSVYRLTPSANRTINGIYVDTTGGGRGQVLLLINDSAYVVKLEGAVVVNARKILGGPCFIGPNGAALVVYDNSNAGWRVVASRFGDPVAFTPTWTGAGSNPAIGDGTLTGEYVVVGQMCQFAIKLTIGASTTLGTGVWSFTLPQTANNGPDMLGPALAQDATYAAGATVKASATTCQAAFHGAATVASPTVPFAWPAGDVLWLSGSFRL